jgi:hypothetical protein
MLPSTAGTAKGRKIEIRANGRSPTRSESSSSANSRASPSITGSRRAPYASTRSEPDHRAPSVSAVR